MHIPRWLRWRIMLGLCVLLGTWVSFGARTPPQAQAQAPLFLNVTLLVGGHQAFARLPTGGLPEDTAEIAAELRRDGALLARDRQPTSLGGDVELAFVASGPRHHRPETIRPGDIVHLEVMTATGSAAALAGRSATFTAGDIQASPRAEAGAIEGAAPPGARVSVTAAHPRSGFASGSALADAEGRWSVSLDERYQLLPGTTGTALYMQDEVVHQTTWALRQAQVAVGSPVVEILEHAGRVLELDLERAPPEDAAGDPVPVRVAQGWAAVWRGGGEPTRVVLRDPSGSPVPLLPGDLLTLRSGPGRPILGELPQVDHLALPPLEVTVEPGARRVAGRTTPDAELALEIGGVSQPLEVDDQGRFAEPLGEGSDAYNTWVTVGPAAIDPVLRWSLRARATAFVRQDPLESAVHGQGTAGDPISMTVLDGGGGPLASATGHVGADGRFTLVARDAAGLPVPWTADTEASLELDGRALRVKARPVIARARASRDRVSGQAAPGSVVSVEHDGRRARSVVGAEGTWRVEGEEHGMDLRPGDDVRLEVWPPGALPATLSFPVFRVSAQSDGDRVRIEGWPGLTTVVEVSRAGQWLATGSCTVFPTTASPTAGSTSPVGHTAAASTAGWGTPSRHSCDALLYGPRGEPAPPLEEGDEVLAYPEHEAMAALEVIRLKAHIDLGGADVVGAAPPREPVEIRFRHDRGQATPLEARIGADDNGVFDYELAASQWELVTPGLIADVYQARPSGHRVFATGVLEAVRAWPGTARVSGIAEPSTVVTATLHAPPSDDAVPSGSASDGTPPRDRMATGHAVTSGDARFSMTLLDAEGQPAILEPGATLVVTHARGTLTMPIETVAAWPLADGTLVGVTAPGRRVRAAVAWQATPGADRPTWSHRAGEAEIDGTFALPAPYPDAPARSATLLRELATLLPGGGELRLALGGWVTP